MAEARAKLTNLHEARPGSGMDRVIERSRPRWLAPVATLALLVAIATTALVLRPPSGVELRVRGDRVTTATASRGVFEDFIPVRGRVTPERTVFLDAVEGGRVDDVLVQDGDVVEEGQLLAVLSNTTLQLDVIAREAEVSEQLNNLRTLELELERNRLEHRRNIIEIDYQIQRLSRLVERQSQLIDRGNISRADVEATQDELDYYQRRREVTLEARDTDERLQESQFERLQASATRLERNLELARRNLEALNVRAPIAGQLTALNAEIGQSLSRGERIGQIDAPDAFKVVAGIDEFYIDRVQPGQIAELTVDGNTHRLRVGRAYPQVNSGLFEIDLLFQETTPDDLRRGQTLQTRLYLGEPQEALLIPYGAFYQDTGGHWVFVVAQTGVSAERREVILGRRNARFVEVLDGLAVGDRVITSSYAPFGDAERLAITN